MSKKKDPKTGSPSDTSANPSLGLRLNVDKFAQTATVLKLHGSRYLGKQRIVTADPYVQPRLELGTPLPDDNGPATDKLSGKTLYAEPLGLAVSSVPGASHSLFVCHTDLLNCHINFFDYDFRMLLAMPARAAVLLLLFIFENQHLFVFSLGFQSA